MNNFSAKWQQLRDKFHVLSERERMIIAGALAVLLLGLFDQLLLRPWMEEREALSARELQLQTDAEQLLLSMTELEQQLANDPNRILQDSIERLQNRHQQVDAEIARITDGMIAPEVMPSLLGELLSERSGLKVQSIKSRPAQRLSGVDGGAQDAPAIYRHELELRLEGSFPQVQRYLQSIEALPRRLIWDELLFAMDKYPRGELLLTVHTLSAREELIRVQQ